MVLVFLSPLGHELFDIQQVKISLWLENSASKTAEYFHMGFNNGNKVVSIG